MSYFHAKQLLRSGCLKIGPFKETTTIPFIKIILYMSVYIAIKITNFVLP